MESASESPSGSAPRRRSARAAAPFPPRADRSVRLARRMKAVANRRCRSRVACCAPFQQRLLRLPAADSAIDHQDNDGADHGAHEFSESTLRIDVEELPEIAEQD